LLFGPPFSGSGVLPLAALAALESASQPPLTFALPHPANRLTAGGATEARRLPRRHEGWSKTSRPVAHKWRQQNSCCVTTRHRNDAGTRRWERLAALSTPALGLGILGFGRCLQTPSSLPPGRLPATDLTEAVGILAVALVPTPWLVPAPTTVAQADPRPRAARTGAATALWIIMTATHGSAISQGTARGERVNVLLGRLAQPGSRGPFASLADPEGTRQGRKRLEKGMAKETQNRQADVR
jgi:hypothetical protein